MHLRHLLKKLEVKMKGCDKEDEDIYSKWIQCNSGGMLPAVGSDKATAAEGGIAPDVMFICHTAGGEGGAYEAAATPISCQRRLFD